MYYVAEVLAVKIDYTKVKFMKPITVRASDGSASDDGEDWEWPVIDQIDTVHSKSILPITPNIGIAVPPSTRRHIVYRLDNYDIVEKFNCE